jgi:CheY-like chemotaxis protein
MLYQKILLVEDDTDDQELFIEVLKEIEPGASWAIAGDGYEGLKVLEQLTPEMPDVIFLDLNMPRMDGFQFLELIKKDERYKQIPVVILSTSNTAAERCYQLEAAICIAKPSTIQHFRNLLKDVLSVDLVREQNMVRGALAQRYNH